MDDPLIITHAKKSSTLKDLRKTKKKKMFYHFSLSAIHTQTLALDDLPPLFYFSFSRSLSLSFFLFIPFSLFIYKSLILTFFFLLFFFLIKL